MSTLQTHIERCERAQTGGGTVSDDLRDELARALALAGDEDGCFVRIDEWEAQAEWEREAQPDERPASDYEDAAYWRRKADALVPIIERVKAEAKAEQREADAQIAESDRDLEAVGYYGQGRVEAAAAIRAAAENESLDRAATKARARLEEWLNSTLGDVHIYPADVRTLLAALEEAEREVAKIAENRNEWASRMMELATTEQKLERAERRIAAVEALVMTTDGDYLDGNDFDGLAGEILAVLHPVAETTEKGGE